jgi:ribonuclease HI
MQKIEVFTDGSATTADKPGGYAWVLIVDDKFHSEGSGRSENATNNDMELQAAVEGLNAAFKLAWPPIEVLGNYNPVDLMPEVVLCSDSRLVLGWASGEYRFKQEHKMVKYKQLKMLMDIMFAQTKWIKGHSGVVWNERCDKLANQARLNLNVDKALNSVDTRIGSKKTGIVSLWYQGILRLVDFEQGIVETYNREAHGKRGSVIEIREGKDR